MKHLPITILWVAVVLFVVSWIKHDMPMLVYSNVLTMISAALVMKGETK